MKHAKRPKPTGHNPSTTSGLDITEDELGKYQEENRRKEAAKQEKLAATEANKLKRSKAANTGAGQAETVLSSDSAGKEWQQHPAPMLLGALRALASPQVRRALGCRCAQCVCLVPQVGSTLSRFDTGPNQ